MVMSVQFLIKTLKNKLTKSNPIFRDITLHVVENMILHEIFRAVLRFPRYILCYIAENRIPLGQCWYTLKSCLLRDINSRGREREWAKNFLLQLWCLYIVQCTYIFSL